jgi:hypothetical protein
MNVTAVGSPSSLYQTAGLATGSGSGTGNTTTVTHFADGSTVSTVRAPTAAVIAVTTTAAASPYVSASAASYGIDVTA